MLAATADGNKDWQLPLMRVVAEHKRIIFTDVLPDALLLAIIRRTFALCHKRRQLYFRHKGERFCYTRTD
jgi:hypothetical protein